MIQPGPRKPPCPECCSINSPDLFLLKEFIFISMFMQWSKKWYWVYLFAPEKIIIPPPQIGVPQNHSQLNKLEFFLSLSSRRRSSSRRRRQHGTRRRGYRPRWEDGVQPAADGGLRERELGDDERSMESDGSLETATPVAALVAKVRRRWECWRPRLSLAPWAFNSSPSSSNVVGIIMLIWRSHYVRICTQAKTHLLRRGKNSGDINIFVRLIFGEL